MRAVLVAKMLPVAWSNNNNTFYFLVPFKVLKGPVQHKIKKKTNIKTHFKSYCIEGVEESGSSEADESSCNVVSKLGAGDDSCFSSVPFGDNCRVFCFGGPKKITIITIIQTRGEEGMSQDCVTVIYQGKVVKQRRACS